MSKIIGIDLGTTYSVCAFVEEGQPKVIPSSEGRNLVPSVVEPQKRLVGDTAKERQIPNYQNTIFSVKRLMGRRFEDASVQYDLKHLPFVIKEGREGMAVIEIEGKIFTPQEISAKILQKIKSDAESYLGEKVEEAVISVPAYFDDGQRQATKQAGEIAGFRVRRIINEPTAASLAYGLGKRKGEKIVVYDLGGGTFDVSVLETGEGVFEVKAVAGDTHLGGDDFDQRIVDLLAGEFKLGKDRRTLQRRVPAGTLQRLRVAAERAKVELTSSLETEIFVPFPSPRATTPPRNTSEVKSSDTSEVGELAVVGEGVKEAVVGEAGEESAGFKRRITRVELEQLTSDLIAKTLKLVGQALSDAKLSPQDIDEVVLAGGMTRMPALRERVQNYFGRKPHTGVNPDEVVGVGAAIQGAILAREIEKVTLIDVTPLSLGVETLGELMTRLIKRNTAIPISVSQIFSTAADDQPLVEIHILQGERELAADNRSLGRFRLDGIPPAPRAVPRIEVNFVIDSNGILNVSAQDLSTGSKQKITVTGSTGLSREEVERMVREAEACAEEDREKREHIVAINQANDLIYAAEEVLSAKGGSASGGKEKRGKAPRCTREPSSSPPLADQNKAPQNIRKEIKEKVKDLRALLGTAGAEELRQKIADLSALMSRATQGVKGCPP